MKTIGYHYIKFIRRIMLHAFFLWERISTTFSKLLAFCIALQNLCITVHSNASTISIHLVAKETQSA